MSYERQNFVDGQVLTAKQLNYIEDGIIENEVSQLYSQAAVEQESTVRQAADAVEKAERQEEIAVERARINQFTRLADGSTTGDAELADIRISTDSKTYESAGKAVRAQIGDIHDMFTIVDKPKNINLFDVTKVTSGCTLHKDEGTRYESESTAEQAFSGFIHVIAGKSYTCYYTDSAGTIKQFRFSRVCGYSAADEGSAIIDNEKENNKATLTITNGTVTIPDGVLYVRFVGSVELFASPFMFCEVSDNPPTEITEYGDVGLVRFKKSDYATSESVDEKIALSQKQWLGKKWVCLGDSLTKGTNTTKTYHDYVAEKTGITVVNKGVASTGWMRRPSESKKPFYERVDDDFIYADVVTVFGSGNDGKPINDGLLGEPTDTGTDTVCGCINTTIDNIYSKNPFVQLAIISPTPWKSNMPDVDNAFSKLCVALETICKNRGIPYLDLFHCSGLRPNDETFRSYAYKYDINEETGENMGVHPDETGHKIIASQFYTLLQSLISIY